MNRFNFLTLTVVAIFMLATAACKKETQPIQPEGNSATLAFVGKRLLMTSFQVNPAIDLNGDGKLDTDLTIFLRDCDKDNTITFEKNGVMSGSNGQLSCSADETDPSVVESSHWTYNESTKTIRIAKDNDPTDVSEWKVLEASASGLTVEVSASESTKNYKTTMAFKAI